MAMTMEGEERWKADTDLCWRLEMRQGAERVRERRLRPSTHSETQLAEEATAGKEEDVEEEEEKPRPIYNNRKRKRRTKTAKERKENEGEGERTMSRDAETSTKRRTTKMWERTKATEDEKQKGGEHGQTNR